MSWTRRIFLSSAILLAAALAWMVTYQRQLTPAEQLAELEARLTRREHHSEAVLLSGLESLAQRAAQRAEDDVAARALIVRGRLLLELGAAERARADFQRVLDLYRPGDLEVRRLAVDARIAEGAHEAALADLESLLADEPGFGPAWTQTGTLHRKLAAQRLERCNELLARIFSREALVRAQPLLARLAAQDLSDPRRATAALQLRQLAQRHESELMAQALAWTEDASRELALARAAFARSLELEADPEAFAGLLAVLMDAGELELATDLGRIVRRHPGFASHSSTNELLLQAGMEQGDMRYAAQVARNLFRVPAADPELLVLASRALYETNDFQRLTGPNGPVLRLRQIARSHVPVADLFSGLVLARRGDASRAIQQLRAFAMSAHAEPFPDARLVAWREIARLARREDNSLLEREALHAAVQHAPDADPALWYRLHELQAAGGSTSSTLPMSSLTQAVRLAPRQLEHLLPAWRELGERSLREEGLDLPRLLESLQAAGQTLPLRPPRPYTMFRLAELWLEAGEPARARFVTRRMLDDLPGFLPALDLAIEASIQLRRWPDVAEQLVRRVEAAGQDARSEEILALLSIERLSPEQVLRLMEAAPEQHGRRLLAQRQRADGWPALALATLAGGDARDDARTRVLAAELLVEAGEYRRALDLIGDGEGAGDATARARRSALLAALRTQALDRVRGLLAVALGDQESRPEELLALVDLLASFEEVVLARALLESLDAKQGARSEDLFLSMASVALLEDALEPALLALARSEYFASSDRSTLGLLLARAQQGDWEGVVPLARELRSEERVASVREVLLALLESQPGEAAELAEQAFEARPQDSFAQLVRALARIAAGLPPDMPRQLGGAAEALRELASGRADERRDPRQTAALLLALETPVFAPLARRELGRLLRSGLARTWTVFLLARSDVALGDPAAGRRALEAQTQDQPGFLPAWEGLEDLLRAQLAPAHPELETLRTRRLQLRSRGPEEELGTHLARSEVFLGRGQPAEALASAERALELEPRSGAARAARAAALTALGDSSAALEAWQVACLAGTRAEAYEHAPAYLEALLRALEGRPPTLLRAQIEPALERLRERLPEDPLVVLAQAELDLVPGTSSAQMGAARARARLAAFRERQAGRTLEGLRAGSAERWGELLLGIDPRAASEFAQAELRLDPAHLGLRLLRARALRAEGRIQEALAGLERLARMAADPRIDLERAACLIAIGSPMSEIEARLRAAQAFGADPHSRHRIEVLRARSRLDAGPEPRAEVLADLERYWRAGSHLLVDPDGPAGARGPELAQLYALHLALGDPRPQATPGVDAEAVRAVVSVLLPATRDPYRRTALEALAGLASHLRPPESRQDD